MKINDILKKNDIHPNDISIYFEAITHKSFSNEKRLNLNYQRLEFLGDTILDFLVADYIYKKYPKLDEGMMSIIKTNTVKTDRLIEFCKKHEINKCIRFGNNKNDFNHDAKFLADVFESFIGALYIDKGLEEVKNFLKKNAFLYVDKIDGKVEKNPKTILQEFLQTDSRGNVLYETIVSHDKFISTVYHDGQKFAMGEGRTKKESQVEAARNTLELLGEVKDEIN